MKGFYIEITNNLLEPKHVKAMGSAIWEYMWCLDKMTSVDEDGIGKVLGGKPVKREDIRQDIGKALNHISENLQKLQKTGYINLKLAPHGNIITINRAKKRYHQKVTPPVTKRSQVESEKVTPGVTSGSHQVLRQGHTYIDKTVDKTVDTAAPAGSWVKESLKRLEDRRGIKFADYGKQIGALGRLQKSGLDPTGIWEKLLALEKHSDFWKDHPPDYVNLAANVHKLTSPQLLGRKL